MTFVCALERSERAGTKRCHGQCPSCATWWPEKKAAGNCTCDEPTLDVGAEHRDDCPQMLRAAQSSD